MIDRVFSKLTSRNPLCVFVVSCLLAQSLFAEPQEAVVIKQKVDQKASKAFEITITPQQLEASIKKGVDYFVKSQNKNGSWGSARNTKGLNIYCPPPGGHHAFRIASTSLALSGLIATEDRRPEVVNAIEAGEKFLLARLPKLKRAEQTTTYNNWGHAYGLRCLADLLKFHKGDASKKAIYTKLAQSQLDRLHIFQDVDGGWGYLSLDSATRRPNGGSMSFCTATVLLAMKRAEDAFGVEYDPTRKKAAIRSIQRQRTPDFSYVYAMDHQFWPRGGINRPAGSLARSQVCNAALRACGDEKVTDKVMIKYLDRLVKRNGWLDIGRKRPIPHETHFSVSGYFYLYGHFYAVDCIEMIPAGQQKEWKRKLSQILISKQEKGGSWWDYPLYDYHKAYGTGYTLSALSRMRWEKE